MLLSDSNSRNLKGVIMKLSAKSRYGLRAMYHLGKSSLSQPVSLNTLAKLSDVSSPYLEKLLGLLKKSHLVVATRGTNGGYNLAKEAKDISVGDIIRALEGEVLSIDCVSKCKKTGCPNKEVFGNLYTEITQILNKSTLQNMIEKN